MKSQYSLIDGLVEDELLSKEDLAKAREEVKKTNSRLIHVIIDLGFIKEDTLVSYMSQKLEIPRIDLENQTLKPEVIDLIPQDLCRKHILIPVLKIGNEITCAMADPLNIFVIDELSMKTKFKIDPAIATREEIQLALDKHLGQRRALNDIIQSMDANKFGSTDQEMLNKKTLDDIAEEPVVIHLVDQIILQAMKEGASDIHIQPEDESLNIRYRVDGVLVEVASCPKNFQAAILSRIKVMAELNIAEHRIPQDGRFEFDRNGTSADIRIATLPTIHGENIVMRVLNSTSSLPTQQQLGFSEELLNQMQKVQRAAHGIILVTGPTGSGKTTTLYTCLAQIDTKQNNIMTVEDPVEYRLPGIRQIQINTKVKLTFANSLRSILRQDPDVILIGEIRDSETAGIAVQAAMTGHLVFSTLHTNDAPSSIMRLIDMNVEPFLVASSVIAVLAQRLVRTICSNCKEEYIPTKTALDDLDLPKDGVYYRGKGCAKCNQTGYKGRVGIYELMIPDRHIRDLVSKRSSIDEIRKQAKTLGMTTLQVDGKAKIKEGLTTIEEVVRVTQDE